MSVSGAPSAEERSESATKQRARELMRQFTYHVAPGSQLMSSQIEDQLKYLQLARAGWVDIITTLEHLNVPNIGAPENVPSTILARLAWQQQMGLGMDVNSAGRKASGQEPPRMVVKES